MNTPNKLTLLRVLMVPLVMLFLLVDIFPYGRYVALALFILASLTDFIDGYLARRNNQITNFGKFLDPLADKLLVIAALVSMIELGMLPAWVVMIIIAREFLVTSLRLVAVNCDNLVIAASFLGKLKTTSQIVAVVAVLLEDLFVPKWLGDALVVVALVTTVWSGIDYLKKYWKYITPNP